MSVSKPTVAIIGGTGALGSGLARRIAAAGYAVIIGSRTAEKAAEAARGIAHPTTASAPRGATNEEAAQAGDIVLVTVPWSSQAAILDSIQPHIGGKLVIDTTVPIQPPKVSRVQLPAEDSAAMAARSRLGGLVEAVGLRGLHAGPLANSTAAEALTCVLIGINRTYKVDGAGIRITGIPTG
jgi:8-hydroxy-5-deazaflavin:NADPH oxidoreductase